MVSHTYVISSNVINQARVLVQPDRRQPGGDERPQPARATASTSPTPTRWRVGLPSIGVRASSRARAGRPAAALRRAHQRRVAVRRRLHLDRGPPLAQVRRRHPPRARCASRSSTARTATSPSTAACTGNAAADFLLGLPAQVRGHDQAGDPGRLRLAVRRLRAGRVPRLAAPDAEPGRALRAADAVHRHERRHHRLPDRACSRTRFPAAPTGLVYPGDPGVPRGIVRDRQEQLRAAPGVAWDPAATAGPACARLGASSTTRSPGRATSSRAACWRRPSRRSSS